MSERRELGRREQDDVLKLLAPHILNDETVQNKILDKLEKIETAQADMLELLTLFKNTKGFFAVLKGLGMVALFCVASYGAILTILHGIKFWLRD